MGRGGRKAKEKARLLEKKLFIQRREDYSHQKHVIQHAYLPYVSCEDAMWLLDWKRFKETFYGEGEP